MKKRNWKTISLYSLFFFVSHISWPIFGSTISSYEGKEVMEILQLMPKKDQKRLEYFFRASIAEDMLGYVLLGEKPMALGVFEKKMNPFESFPVFLYALSPQRRKSKKGFKTWKKYEKILPITRFAFLYEETPSDTFILFINKKNFAKKVAQHAEDFTTILQSKITGEELLEKGIHKPLLAEVLQNHDGLIGTLFGYGRENAHLYHQAIQFPSEKETDRFFEEQKLEGIWDGEEEEFRKKYQESVGWISNYITGSHLKNLELIFLPSFRAVLDHPETIALKQQYFETKQKIIHYYEDKKFLEATLTLLLSKE